MGDAKGTSGTGAGAGKIPLVDLKAQYATIREEIDGAIARVIGATSFIGGPEVAGIEKEFASFCEAEGATAIGTSSGTTALHLALVGCGVGPGDEVATVAHTFIATAEMIGPCGARPVFVDVDPATGNMDPTDLRRRITPRTKAILPVHLYGCPVELDEIRAIAAERGVPVIEDAAQAHGARYRGRRVGGLTEMSCFSFYPGKNLGAYGDGGMLICRDKALGDRLRSLANHGRHDKYVHDVEGFNYRLDGLQAAILRAKLPHLADWNEARRRAARWYDERLGAIDGIDIYRYPAHVEPVYHLYVVRVERGRRDAILAYLKAQGVDAGVHYPVPLHLQPAYRHLEMGPGSLPHTEDSAARCLSLPIYPEIREEQVDRAAAVLREAVAAV